MRNIKRLVLGVSIPILIIGLGLILVFAVFKTARVHIMVAPENATITINGKEYKNGVHSLFPGVKTVKVSGEGIEEYETQFDAKMFTTKRVAIYRKVNGSYDSYMKSRSDYLVLKALSAEQDDPQAVEFLRKVDNARKIFDELPQDFNNTITIGEGKNTRWVIEKAHISDYSNNQNCPAAICILLQAPSPSKVDIREMIEGRGYNFDDYYIVEKKING
jgi:hypothetical protein